MCYWTLKFQKTGGMFWLTENRLASQVGLCSMEWVSKWVSECVSEITFSVLITKFWIKCWTGFCKLQLKPSSKIFCSLVRDTLVMFRIWPRNQTLGCICVFFFFFRVKCSILISFIWFILFSTDVCLQFHKFDYCFVHSKCILYNCALPFCHVQVFQFLTKSVVCNICSVPDVHVRYWNFH
jgi:hypothetical protein